MSPFLIFYWSKPKCLLWELHTDTCVGKDSLQVTDFYSTRNHSRTDSWVWSVCMATRYRDKGMVDVIKWEINMLLGQNWVMIRKSHTCLYVFTHIHTCMHVHINACTPCTCTCVYYDVYVHVCVIVLCRVEHSTTEVWSVRWCWPTRQKAWEVLWWLWSSHNIFLWSRENISCWCYSKMISENVMTTKW